MSKSSKSFVKYKIVECIWLDSDHHGDWEKLSDVLEDQEGNLECRSVGYLIADKEDRIILATSITNDDETEEQVSYYISIPKVAILSQKELRKR